MTEGRETRTVANGRKRSIRPRCLICSGELLASGIASFRYTAGEWRPSGRAELNSEACLSCSACGRLFQCDDINTPTVGLRLVED